MTEKRDTIASLPSVWKFAKLGDLVTIRYGKGLPTTNLTAKGYPVFGANGVIGFYDKYLYEEEQVLISCRGAYSGKINLSPQKSFVTNNSLVLEILKPKELEKKYLYYALHAVDKSKLVTGTAQPQVTINNAIPLEISLAPVEEQKRIVAEIEKQFSRLDEAVANLKRVKVNLKRYKASVLKAALEGRLVETESELAHREGRTYETGEQLLKRILETRRSRCKNKEKYKEPVTLDTIELPELPKGWGWATLDQISQEERPVIYGIIKPGPHVSNGVPYVRVTEMKDGVIDVASLKRTAPERAAKFARATLAPGDVLISKDGTIGRVAVVPPELAGGNITQHVMRAPIHTSMCRDYVVWAIRSDICQKWLTRETRGVALRGVNVEDFRRLPIPLSPLSEQQRIVAEVERRLSIINAVAAEVDINIRRAESMRQALLVKAFKGALV